MIFILVLLNTVGFLLSSNRRIGFYNPFQIYFFIWTMLFFCYWIFEDSFIYVSPEYFLIFINIAVFSIIQLLFFCYSGAGFVKNQHLMSQPEFHKIRVLIANILAIIILIFAYRKAKELAGGDIFNIIGYTKLRIAYQTQKDYFLYFELVSFVVSSIALFEVFFSKRGYFLLASSIATSLFYAYLSTNRTIILVFVVLTLYPLVLCGVVRLKGIVIGFFILAFMFGLTAFLTSKGLSAHGDFYSNMNSMLVNLRAYTIAPFLAMYKLMQNFQRLYYGEHILRGLFSLLHLFGASVPAGPPLKQYASVPDFTNVYTVYRVYYEDFSYFGFFIPPALLTLHWYLYKNACNFGGIWIFMCSVLLFPLVLQFFEDEYLNSLSLLIRLCFLYWFFIKDAVRVHP